jgi:hypothetical protein
MAMQKEVFEYLDPLTNAVIYKELLQKFEESDSPESQREILLIMERISRIEEANIGKDWWAKFVNKS